MRLAIPVLAIWLSSAPASADILIESYRGERPADADRILAPVRAELLAAGVSVEPAAVIADAGRQLPLAGESDPALGLRYPEDIEARVDAGTTQIFRGEYDRGLATLDEVLAIVRANPAHVVADMSSAAWLTKARGAIAFGHLRSQRIEAATEVLTEHFRSFPGQPIGRLLGPEIAALESDVRAALDSAPRGTLRVVVSRPEVQIALDERTQADTGNTFRDLVPGTYRLLLVHGATSRRYEVSVVARRTTELRVDWNADTAFHATSRWVGFAGPRGRTDDEIAAVTRYAQSGDRHHLFLVGIVVVQGRRLVTGAVFEKRSGAILRRKAIALDRDGVVCARALARYLVRNQASSCLREVPADADEDPAPSAHARDPYTVPGVVGGLGASAVLGGIAVLAGTRDPPGRQSAPRYDSNAGIGLMIAGGLAIGGAAYLASRAAGRTDTAAAMPRRSRGPIYASVGTAIAAFAVGGYLLHLDGRSTCDVAGECFYVHRTARPGWGLLGAGAVASGFAVYWSLRSPRDARAATLAVSTSDDGALATIRGTF